MRRRDAVERVSGTEERRADDDVLEALDDGDGDGDYDFDLPAALAPAAPPVVQVVASML